MNCIFHKFFPLLKVYFLFHDVQKNVFNFMLQAWRPHFSKFGAPQNCLAGLIWNVITFTNLSTAFCRSQWTRGLRHRSTTVRLLGSWVRIPPGAWTFVCCVCCQVEVTVTRWPLVQGSRTNRGASLCVTSKPHEWGVRIRQAEPLGDFCSK